MMELALMLMFWQFVHIVVRYCRAGDSIHDLHGFIPGFIEADRRGVSKHFGGPLPQLIGWVAALASAMAVHFIGAFAVLAAALGLILVGVQLPPLEPVLYYTAAAAILVGFGVHYRVTWEVRTAEWYRGY